ncbi:MAG TPA: FAD-dependent oxidoreductase [Holophagaceae bacterium]|nr:FAD-dependent oxidoreductase [Holophagaceae bacterium]
METLVMKRRTFLATAAAAVALSCKRKPAFEAALVAPDMATGHRLRQGGLPEPERWEEVPVLIVGGGIAGLSAAWQLDRLGLADFRILELESAPGGTARGSRNGISPFPLGAHYLPAPPKAHAALVELLAEAGAVEALGPDGEPRYAEQMLVREPEERIFAGGQWWEGLYFQAGANAEDLRQLRAFQAEVDRLAGWRDAQGRSAFALPRAQGSDAPEIRALDRLTLADWCNERGLTSPRLRWMLDYGCRDDYGLHFDETSAWAGLFYFAARQQGPRDRSRPLLAWPQGNGFLVEHLAAKAGARLRTGQALASLRSVDAGVEARVLEVASGRMVGLRARRAIFAGPLHVAGAVVEGLRVARGPVLAAFQRSPWLVVNLTLRTRPREVGFPMAWDNVLRDSPSLGYVVATHQRGLDAGPTVWTWYHPFTGEEKADRARLFAMDAMACAEMALTDLERAHPEIRELVARADVARWGHAMVRPRPGFCWSEALVEARQPFGPVHFAHTELSGLALFEEAFDHGLRAAGEVRDALQRSGSRRT